MDLRKISLYLSWKIPPEYKKYSRLKFFELLETEYGIDTTKANFYWEQANKYEEEFYQLVLEYLQQKSIESDAEKVKYEWFLDKLGIDDEIKSDDLKLVLWEYKNEKDFTTNFLLDFFKRLGYSDVRYTHWRKEYWKDIVMRKIDEFGNWRYIGVQVKIWDVSWKVNWDIDEIKSQIDDWFNMGIPDLDSKAKVKFSEFIVVTNGKYTENAVEKIMEKFWPWAIINNVTFIDRTKLNNLLDQINQ